MTPAPARPARPAAPPRPGPLSLRDVVSELVDTFHDPGDWPAQHRCTKEGLVACSHAQWAARALLVRVAHLVQRGVGPAGESDAPKPTGKRGSPAPWAAGPALLVDEAHRGAVRFDRELRAALDLGPLYVHRGWRIRDSWHPPLARPWVAVTSPPATRVRDDLAGVAALRGLPLLVDEGQPDRGRGWGAVERAVRRWHSEAREITGHVSKPMIVRERRNPFAGLPWVGPTCADPWRCGHLSCRLLFLVPRPAWERVVCPHCGAAGFPQDPATGELRCARPRCRDENGKRPSWSVEGFMAPIAEVAAALEVLR